MAENETTQTYSYAPEEIEGIVSHLISRTTRSGDPKPMQPGFIWGPPGIGKTDIVKSLSRETGRTCVALHLPQCDSTDLRGLPVANNGRVKWNVMSSMPQSMTLPCNGEAFKFVHQWNDDRSLIVTVTDKDGDIIAIKGHPDYEDSDGIESVSDVLRITGSDFNEFEVDVKISADLAERGHRIHCEESCMLFLDELSAADPLVQNSALQLCLDRAVGEYELPMHTPVMAAGNRETDGGFIQAMSAPLANRFVHLPMRADLRSFTRWALMNDVPDAIVAYIQANPDQLFKYEEGKQSDGDLGFPTPRMWVKLGQQLTEGLDEKYAQSLARGLLGKTIGDHFTTFRRTQFDLPKPDQILYGEKYDKKAIEGAAISTQYLLQISLCRRLAQLRNELEVPENGAGVSKDDHPEDWKKVTENFAIFANKYFSAEMIMNSFSFLGSRHGITLNMFHGDGSEQLWKDRKEFLRMVMGAPREKKKL